MARAYLPKLDDQLVASAAEQHHAFWGGTRSLAAHTARVREQIARGGGRMRYVGLQGEDGSLVCSLKRYALQLQWGEAEVAAVGIGAVYTPEAARGRGHAAELMRQLLVEASAEGASAALLFSDIEPSYYERLGFVTVSRLTWSARADALPTGPSLLGDVIDDVACCELFEESWPAGFIRARRHGDGFAFGSWLNGSAAARALQWGGARCGYLCAGASEDTLWIDEAVTIGVEASALWSTLRALAEQHGAKRVGGWLRPEHAGGPFVATARSRCIPMLARLDDGLPAASDLRAHFSSIDHF